MIIVYKATNKTNGKIYIGVSEHFERRLTEHMRSHYPFGKALRKYGIDNFVFDLTECNTNEEAYALEATLVTQEEVDSPLYYNACVGGIWSPDFKNKVNGDKHWTSRRKEVLTKRSVKQIDNALEVDTLVTENKGGIAFQRKVIVSGVVYDSVRGAGRCLGISRQCLIHRIKSINFPEYSYHFG